MFRKKFLIVCMLLISSSSIYLLLYKTGPTILESTYLTKAPSVIQPKVTTSGTIKYTVEDNSQILTFADVEYCVFTPSCTIPDVNPWHASLSKFIQKTNSLNCEHTSNKTDFTYVQGDTLYVNQSNSPSDFDFCEFVEILRPESGDRTIKLSLTRHVFTQHITVYKYEFIKVYCYDTSQRRIYTNLHARTPPKPLIEKTKSAEFNRHKRLGYKEHMNVLMVGLDSVSRLNFHRQFPQTYSLLKTRMSVFEMKGYNKVRDNTFINLVPMFLGKFVEETGWNEMISHNTTFDKQQYSWKDYSQAGYHTLFAEDAPNIAIWNFEKPGFDKSPADYYYRPFALALENAKENWHNNHHCFGERLETDIILGYITDFIKTRGNNPYFAFTYLTRPTYDTVNQNTDHSHYEFLNNLLNDDLLSNTVVIYFSDHGARRGNILSTYIGKLEERLPAMFISLPLNFIQKYPQIVENMMVNEGRLTTPFDIHSTLDHILHFSGAHYHSNNRSYSLLAQVPATRDCSLASIDNHWCTCLIKKSISTSHPQVKQAALSAVSYINQLTLKHRKSCSLYVLSEITDALESTPRDKMLTHKETINDVLDRKTYFGPAATHPIKLYLIMFKVLPGLGEFEATVRYDSVSVPHYVVSGEISRTSLYGLTSSCVDGHFMKKFCYCKS